MNIQCYIGICVQYLGIQCYMFIIIESYFFLSLNYRLYLKSIKKVQTCLEEIYFKSQSCLLYCICVFHLFLYFLCFVCTRISIYCSNKKILSNISRCCLIIYFNKIKSLEISLKYSFYLPVSNIDIVQYGLQVCTTKKGN